LTDELSSVEGLLRNNEVSVEQREYIRTEAINLVEQSRQNYKGDLLSLFLLEFSLSNQEGIALMCLAESLLRVKDSFTADKLIEEKIKSGNWSKHIGESSSLLVNASTWGLLFTGKIITLDDDLIDQPANWFKRTFSRLGEPLIRQAMYKAIEIMSKQYVLGETIDKALKRCDNRFFVFL
jgi:RHH-type proline utilization regulon transcriptional repressor/proline dehydrogenase/delta 1-pyrroline-5-carboxylate dehydrogenase